MSMRCIAVLTVLLKVLSVQSYSFASNSSAYQRLDLHNRHSSFGAAVCVQGDVAIVTAPYYSFNEYQDPDGILYVYRRDNGFWTLIRGITDLEYADKFGVAADMHTDYFTVVGAPHAHKYGSDSGTAYYMYVEPNPYKTQMEVKRVIQSERHAGAGFGSSVAVGSVNGEVVVAVGAPGHRGRGAVFTFTRQSDGTLGNEEILYPSNLNGPEAFGRGVEVAYNMVLGGAPSGKQGFVYVFQRGSGQSSFSETSVLMGISGYTDDNDDQNYQEIEIRHQVEEFGLSIAAAEGHVFVGAPYAYSQSNPGSNYGSVTVFSYDAATSADTVNQNFLMQEVITPDYLPNDGLNSFFGISLSYCETDARLAIGSPYGEYPSTSLGAVSLYVFNTYDNVFELEAVLDVESYKPDANMGDMQNFGETEFAGFGASLSVSGGFILVGAPQGASHYGDAYFFAAGSIGSDDSTSFYDLITGNVFTTFGLFLFPIAIIGLVVLLLLWRKYRDSNYDDSFGNFIIEEVGEFFGKVQSESLSAVDSCTSLQFMGEDDSAHSTHPMIVGSSVPAPTKKKSKKGKSSKFKSKTGIGNYESVVEDNL